MLEANPRGCREEGRHGHPERRLDHRLAFEAHLGGRRAEGRQDYRGRRLDLRLMVKPMPGVLLQKQECRWGHPGRRMDP